MPVKKDTAEKGGKQNVAKNDKGGKADAKGGKKDEKPK
jgi:hypothetical protein